MDRCTPKPTGRRAHAHRHASAKRVAGVGRFHLPHDSDSAPAAGGHELTSANSRTIDSSKETDR